MEDMEAEGDKATPGDLKQWQWFGTVDVYEVWFSAVSKEISLDKVPFGLRLGRAQMRLLLQQHVLEVVDSLRESPPPLIREGHRVGTHG